MLYGLTSVANHPIYKLHEAFGQFLDSGLQQKTFGDHCFPKWFSPVLSASSGLRNRCEAVYRQSRKQDASVQDSIITVWKSHSDVRQLCESKKCKIANWTFNQPKLIDALSELFDYLYKETLQSKTFEKAVGSSLIHHYEAFRGLGQRVCPFCGLNYYVDRGSDTRSGYDHFLPQVEYPLAAVNFKNLVPMCDHCNEPPGKGMKDVLFKDSARTERRKFYYPYCKPGGVSLSIKCTQLPTLANRAGAWKVKAKAKKNAEADLVVAWDSLFSVQTRYSARIKEGLDGWMTDFLNTRNYAVTPSVARLRMDLSAKATWLSKEEQLRTMAEASLKSATFRYLAKSAPDAVLAGYAGVATSSAIVRIPKALGCN